MRTAASRSAKLASPSSIRLVSPSFLTYIAESEEAAREESHDSIMHFYREQAALLEGAARLLDPVTRERRLMRVAELRRRSFAEALEANLLVGTSDGIAARLQVLRQTIGLNGLLAELNCSGRIPHAKVLSALRLLCEEIQPRYR